MQPLKRMKLTTKTFKRAQRHKRRWENLCARFLPFAPENSPWRLNRAARKNDPAQGWKLHISATVPDACDVFAAVAGFLTREDVQFKAPRSLDDLADLNCGLRHGYTQIGKFITVYPKNERHAVLLAKKLHRLTVKYAAVTVPFDNCFLPQSSVFYRYGAFATMEMTGEDGKIHPALINPAGESVFDDRYRPYPEWISDPFVQRRVKTETNVAAKPFFADFKVFRAITQRGKGGTYHAIDFSVQPPRLCILKEGRKNGELTWSGQDGFSLVENEFEVLNSLRMTYRNAPQPFSSFETDGNFYMLTECVEGVSLNNLLKPRRRRFPIKQTVWFAFQIAQIIEEIHQAGWIWNDCKPANLIVTKNKTLRPIDFENAYRINQSAPFAWKTEGFSSKYRKADGRADDLFALGAVIYFLLTGRLYDEKNVVSINKLRRGVPKSFCEITEQLLSVSENLKIGEVRRKLREIFDSY